MDEELTSVGLTDPRALRAYAHPLRMGLLGLLRRTGPMTATQAAAQLGESVPNCSFHLRQLAKYGLAERSPGSDARERPWRATADTTTWEDDSDDPGLRAATDELNRVVLDRYVARARAHLATRAGEPVAWRAVTGFGDRLAHLTAEELAQVRAQIDAVFAPYTPRLADPAQRPEGSRPIQVFELVLPAPDGA